MKHFALARQASAGFGDRPHRGGERTRHAVRKRSSPRPRHFTRKPRDCEPADAMQKLDAEQAREEADG